MFKPLLGDIQIYGPIGILISYCFWLFPAILMLMMVSFRSVDQRLIEASLSLGKNIWKTHYHVTLPTIRYGLISASLVAFIYVLTDFGIPKVIGGSFNMMALDVYVQSSLNNSFFNLKPHSSCGFLLLAINVLNANPVMNSKLLLPEFLYSLWGQLLHVVITTHGNSSL